MATEDKTPDEIREEIAQTREQLGDTVEALGAKTDVKGRAQDKVEEVKANVKEKLPGGGGESAPGEGGGVSAAPKVVAEKAQAIPAPVAIGLALVLGYLIGRRMGG